MKHRMEYHENNWLELQQSIGAKRGGSERDLHPHYTMETCEKKAAQERKHVERIQEKIKENEAKQNKEEVDELPYICPDCHEMDIIATHLNENRFQVSCEGCAFEKVYTKRGNK